MFNNITLMGRIVNDLELNVTPNGTNVCQFRIAVDRRFQTKDGERKTDFFNIVTWRKTAEFVSNYFSKGRMILVRGELQTRQYTNKNGNPATWYEIIADEVVFTGEKKQSDGGAPITLPPEPPQSAGENVPLPGEPSEDAYPF